MKRKKLTINEPAYMFKEGTVELNDINCGKIIDFQLEIKNGKSIMGFQTERKYSFSITMKLPLIDRIKKFFGFKTRWERLFEK